MRNIYVVFAREIQSFYVSPLYYILGFIYLKFITADWQ